MKTMLLVISLLLLVGCSDYNEIYSGDALDSADAIYQRYGSLSRCHLLTAVAVGAVQARSIMLVGHDAVALRERYSKRVDYHRKAYGFDDEFFSEADMFISAGFNAHWVESHSDLNGEVHVLSIMDEVREYCTATTPKKVSTDT